MLSATPVEIAYKQLFAAIMKRGKECAVAITGDPDDANFITSTVLALQSIDACLQLGIERNHQLRRLEMSGSIR